jgi:glutamyl-Q tRNA(Asp) synthetase
LSTAIGSWLLARQAGGEWLVRIEDIDPPREVPGAAQSQLRALAAFGLVSDLPVLYQSARSDRYARAIDLLRSAGRVFDCACSRSDLAAQGSIHRRCVPPAGEHRQWAIRLRVEDGSVVESEDALQGRFHQDVAVAAGDFVLKRADGYWAYQLAVVVDDAEQEISDIVRGADLLDSTPRQILLQRALGLPTPRYLHLPLVIDESGQKLSKSLSSIPVDPADPVPALRAVWAMLGQEPSALPASGSAESRLLRVVSGFQADRIPRALSAIDFGPAADRS